MFAFVTLDKIGIIFVLLRESLKHHNGDARRGATALLSEMETLVEDIIQELREERCSEDARSRNAGAYHTGDD